MVVMTTVSPVIPVTAALQVMAVRLLKKILQLGDPGLQSPVP